MTEPDHTPPARGRHPLRAAVWLLALIPLIPVLIGLGLTSGSASAGHAGSSSGSPFTVAGVTAPKQAAATHPAGVRLSLPGGQGALVAQVLHPVSLRARPHGPVIARALARTQFGSADVMLARRVSGKWLGVVSSLLANQRLGWIPAADASLSRVDWSLQVSLSHRRLTVRRGGAVVARYTVAIGMPSAPTPTGDFAVTDRLLTGDPSGPYGCCIVALSAKAPHAIQDWNGGNRIAIHSTPETASIGEAASHGCLRLTLAEGRWLVNHIPLGTPAVISS